ncbi:TIM complex componenet Tim54 [Paecilomyces variotii No. 5]|uniref:Mitochondrial import inner membrane translocase subunit TIM54 n=1 Tax=Byssochlamys spectabilis (strain No. 5 / NBRC 109023) TaxID=1356009 RepID=V5G156_BYSSN|nr:TIM complex componenet Tim54 [Paecilomyces variotii No. 5]
MADSSNSSAPSGQPQNAVPKPPPKPQNPALRMMGLPHIRFRLPSRNWMIFLTITGSFTGALIYDRREKKRAQQKWCNLVAHMANEPLPVDELRRRVTIFLAAPPGDGLRVAREHFQEYIKPILVAAALDYDFVEGRREGDVRAGLAEKIRKFRRRAGEPSSVVEEPNKQNVLEEFRRLKGSKQEDGPKGDIVIGRHTWKEYIRGLHEGWLGPLDPPPPPPAPPAPEPETPSSDDASPIAGSEEQKKTEEKKPEQPATPPGQEPAYISPADYASRPLPPTMPSTLEGSAPIPFPHILGFMNTPIRIYRFLTKRYLADDIGREVAAIVLASSARPYGDSFGSSTLTPTADTDNLSSPQPTTSDDSSPSSTSNEQQTVLEGEEKEWHKSVHKRSETIPDEEREWLDDMVVDPRIASRMRRFVLAPEEKDRAQRIIEGKEWVKGEEKPAHVPLWKRLWIEHGYGEDEATLRRKPILGNIDDE